MEPGPITKNADVIHTDDLYSRIKWLEQELNYRCTDEHSRELQALMALAKSVEATTSKTLTRAAPN